MFGAAGDTDAFDCIRSDGTTIVNADDPPTQPWVTSVGGTSMNSFNPGANPHPRYPDGVETVWNVDDLCNADASEGGQTSFFWCVTTGAGAGGYSQFWGRPFYQQGPGITNRYTAYGNGTTNCALAPDGTPCREVPDISANADEYTPYAEYCTGSAARGARRLPTAPAPPSAAHRLHRAGSASAAPVFPRRCGRRSSQTASASSGIGTPKMAPLITGFPEL